MNFADTIAALSSAVAPAARVIVRVSGREAHAIARQLADLPAVDVGRAVLTRVWPGVAAWLYAFAGPRSYTGDHLVEFHIPGSPVLARMVLGRIVALGARHAEPGEFTARAYFNGRLDLTQAEGVAATIAAGSERELRAARQLLAGELARRLAPVMDSLAQTLALVEVGIDFADEDVTFLPADQVRARCAAAAAALTTLLAESARFERLAHEPRIVLIGRPNAGKSTLLNVLAGSARAIVSDVAGTTRDAIWAEVRLRRGMVRVVDVAGIEAGDEHRVPSSEAQASIARQMREQAMREAGGADRVVLVRDPWTTGDPVRLERPVDLVVYTKADLLGGRTDLGIALTVSALSGEGMGTLRQRLDDLAFGPEAGGAGLALNARHVRAIEEARDALARADASVEAGGEVVALDLREALDALGGILGKLSPDDLLGRVFSAFCIGK